jgi:pyruvate kinase
MRRTKIVCTIGPASEKPTTLTAMMRAGMDVARLNFSHGTHSGHRALYRSIRKAAKTVGKHVPIIGDLQGPKIRLGTLPKEGVHLTTGSDIVISTTIDTYRDGVLPVTHKKLHKELKVGERVLIDDGLVEAKVHAVRGKRIQVKIINGGKVSSHKGMNFPDSNLTVSAMTAKDKKDAEFAVKLGVDWLALSFVTDAKEVKTLKRLIKKHTPKGQSLARVIVKIEKRKAIDNFEAILKAADGVMIARGDLGVEIDAEEVPVRQKEMIETARRAGKPVIVATQMLDSMMRNPRPTRAEVSDVANAVFDHTDGVMLSGESATGKYPLKAVKMMKKIVVEAEASPFDDVPLKGQNKL